MLFRSLTAADALYHLIGDKAGAHFGLQVIGGHLGAGDQRTILTGIGGLHAAVKEEGDMGVLLGFGDPQPVSYTHLDVYKRQVVLTLHFIPGSPPRGGAPAVTDGPPRPGAPASLLFSQNFCISYCIRAGILLK